MRKDKKEKSFYLQRWSLVVSFVDKERTRRYEDIRKNGQGHDMAKQRTGFESRRSSVEIVFRAFGGFSRLVRSFL